MRTAYLDTLYELAKKDKDVYAVISDNGAIVYDKYRQDFPDQFINAGISEANMVAMAAGMAERGKIPFAYTIGAFLAYRAFEFILNDVCWMNKNVKMVGIGSGCSYSLLGSSHHTIFDVSVLRPLPNLTIFSPASPREVKKVVRAAYEINGPVYIRLGTNREEEIYGGDYEFKTGKGVIIREGTDVCIMSTGSIVADAIRVADNLEKRGVSAKVVNMHTLKPFDEELVRQISKQVNLLVTLEEHSICGGLGSIVSEILAETGAATKLKRIGLKGFANGYGKHPEVKQMNGLGVESIADEIMKTK